MTAKAIFCSFVFAWIAASSQAQSSLRMGGADLLGEVIKPLLEAAKAERGWPLDFDFSGSLIGERSLLSGEMDLVILALPLDNPPKGDFRSWPLAFEVTSVVVNELNPVKELKLEQLRKIFAQSASGENETLWSALGADGTWASRQVNLHAVRQREHLNLELFRAIVLGPREMKTGVRYWSSPEKMLAAIAEDTTALGLLPVEENHPQVRSLFLSVGEGNQAYNPTPQSVFYGDYPLRLSFYLVAPNKQNPVLSEIERFLFSEEVAEALRAAGYQPLPETERRGFQMDLDLGS